MFGDDELVSLLSKFFMVSEEQDVSGSLSYLSEEFCWKEWFGCTKGDCSLGWYCCNKVCSMFSIAPSLPSIDWIVLLSVQFILYKSCCCCTETGATVAAGGGGSGGG